MQQCREDAIGRMLYLTTMAFKKYLEFRLRPYDLTTEQFQILKQLHEHGCGVSQSQIAEGVAKSPANITRMLDRLEAKQWLERRDNPDDRRSSLVYLTKEGNGLIDRVMLELADVEARVTEGVSPARLQEIRNVMMQMQKNIEENLSEGEKK